MKRAAVILAMSACHAVGLAGETPGEPVVLKIRPHALVRGATPTLADVLVFGAENEVLRSAVGGESIELPPPPAGPAADMAAPAALTYEQIEQRLRELKVDLGRVLIGGASQCRVTLVAQPGAGGSQPGAAVPQPGVGASQPGTAGLQEVLRAQIARELAELGGTPEIEFEQAGGPLLALTSPPYEFAVQSSGRAKLGLREFRVTLRKDGQVQRTVALAARVRLAREVLVARRPLSVGTFVQAADVALAPHVLEREDELGLERAEQALGQQIARFLPAGQMLRRGDLKSVELVRRSRPVVILGAGRNVHVRLTGVALDSGTYGQMVRVRIGDPRQPRRELRAVVTGVGTVRLEEQAL